MKCGEELIYLEEIVDKNCSLCGNFKAANALCKNDHFVCDTCHTGNFDDIVKSICLETTETDMIKLLNKIRMHPSMPLHGPEHHFAIASVIVTTYKNLGGKIDFENVLDTAIERGKQIPGGTCGFWGGCGAALGSGIGMGILIESNPLKPIQRQALAKITGEVIQSISMFKSARCCRRETITALKTVASLSEKHLNISLKAEENSNCGQFKKNEECPEYECPYYVIN